MTNPLLLQKLFKDYPVIRFEIKRYREGYRLFLGDDKRELTFFRRMHTTKFEALTRVAQRYCAEVYKDGHGYIYPRKAFKNPWGNCVSELLFLVK